LTEEERRLDIVIEAVRVSSHEKHECTGPSFSEWETILQQHEISQKQIMANDKRLCDLQKEIRILQEQVHKVNHWSVVIPCVEDQPSARAEDKASDAEDIPLDGMKIYTIMCSLQGLYLNR